MNLALHIARKDARRLWIPLALWSVLIVTRHAVDWRILHADEDGVWLQRMRIASVLAFLLQILVGYILAGALVLEDPSTGSQVFWMTRPIAGVRMLAAKLLGGFFFFIALPVLISLPWWFAQGRQVAPVLGDLLLWQVSVTGAAILVASFSENLGRFLGWSLVFPVLIAMTSGGHRLGSLASMSTVTKLLGVAALAGFAVAVILQYGARQKRIAKGMLFASTAIALAALFRA